MHPGTKNFDVVFNFDSFVKILGSRKNKNVWAFSKLSKIFYKISWNDWDQTWY